MQGVSVLPRLVLLAKEKVNQPIENCICTDNQTKNENLRRLEGLTGRSSIPPLGPVVLSFLEGLKVNSRLQLFLSPCVGGTP